MNAEEILALARLVARQELVIGSLRQQNSEQAAEIAALRQQIADVKPPKTSSARSRTGAR